MPPKQPKQTREKIYEGSNKIMYQGKEEYTLVQFFKDEMRINPAETITVSGKGVLCNSISAHIMQQMDSIGIDNHFIEKVNMREQLIQLVDIFPAQVHISNLAAGRYVEQFGMEEGFVFDRPTIDFRLKNSTLGYPVLNEQQIMDFGWGNDEDIKQVKRAAGRVNDYLSGMFNAIGIRVVDCKLEFGRIFNGEEFIMMLADEISPDTCRLWDIATNRKLDFEAIAENPGEAIKIYQEIASRLNIVN